MDAADVDGLNSRKKSRLETAVNVAAKMRDMYLSREFQDRLREHWRSVEFKLPHTHTPLHAVRPCTLMKSTVNSNLPLLPSCRNKEALRDGMW